MISRVTCQHKEKYGSDYYSDIGTTRWVRKKDPKSGRWRYVRKKSGPGETTKTSPNSETTNQEWPDRKVKKRDNPRI